MLRSGYGLSAHGVLQDAGTLDAAAVVPARGRGGPSVIGPIAATPDPQPTYTLRRRQHANRQRSACPACHHQASEALTVIPPESGRQKLIGRNRARREIWIGARSGAVSGPEWAHSVVAAVAYLPMEPTHGS